MEPIYDIVKFIRNTKYEDLPAEVVELVKQDILDFCGNLLAGSSDPTVRKTCELFSEWGGREETSVFIGGGKLPAPQAVLLNGTMSFAVDYDDTHMQGGHIGVAVFPAALAVAEMKGNVSGKEFLAAVAVAMEFMVRLGVYNKRRVDRHIFGGWEYHGLHAGLAAAAAAGKLLELTEEQMLNAMGLAYYQASGTGLAALEHADSKMLGPGFGGRDGLISVLMAQKGITGAHNILSGDYGMGNMYHDGCDCEGMVSGVGEKWELLDMGFKPYASCRLGHRTLDAVRRLVLEHDIKPEEVKRVDIMGAERVVEQLYAPPEHTKHPNCRNAAVFSLPWVVASLITYRKVGVGQLSEEALENEAVHTLAQKVFAQVDENTDPADHAAALPVVIHTERGSFETLINPIAPGDKGYRIPQAELEAKFHDNASFCIRPVSCEARQCIIDSVMHFERCGNAACLVELLS